MEDDYQGIIDPPSSFAPLEEWERFERDTLRYMNPNWPMTKAIYACLQKRREREPWFQKIRARQRTNGDG